MSPKKTALYPVHEKLGAAFTDFGGWDMPLKYANDVAEHQAVRTRAGIFDLSHMGEFRITGPDAAAFLDYALVSNMSVLKPGRAKYSILANDKGGVIDDLITYRLGDEEFLVVPNAANIDKDFAAEKLAETIDADILLILTAVENVKINFKKENEENLKTLTADEAFKYIAKGEFAAGSMLPKIETGISFVSSGKNRTCIITNPENAINAIESKTGTKIIGE